jgi:hypothetical protein
MSIFLNGIHYKFDPIKSKGMGVLVFGEVVRMPFYH